MRSGPTRKQILAGSSAIALLITSMAAKHIVLSHHTEVAVQRGARVPESPIQRVIDLDFHNFRDIRAHQELWDPRDKSDVLTIAKLGQAYHKAIAAIDLTACPKSFRSAYTAHTNHWETISTALTASANTATDQDALASDVREITKPLEATWARVQSTAREVGVHVKN